MNVNKLKLTMSKQYGTFRKVIIVPTMLTLFPFMAFADNVADQRCAEFQDFSMTVAVSRQLGIPKAKVMESVENPEGHPHLILAIEEAYKFPIYQTDENRENAVNLTGTKMYNWCQEAFRKARAVEGTRL